MNNVYLSSQKQLFFFTLAAVLFLVVIAYLPSLKNDFVNWDDGVHLLQNKDIATLDFKHLKAIFQSHVNTIYLPLTLLSFSVEHHFFGFDPFIYHLNNLILHVLVTALIYWLIYRWTFSISTATIAALLFGIHPTHVESVAWVTERKDVLYAFFYLAALHCYWSYI